MSEALFRQTRGHALFTAELLQGLKEQGRTAEARQTLADIYGWSTEGFGTKDLQDT